jgi:NAD(P)H-hydrate epimerase
MSSLDDITHSPLPQLPPRRADSHKGDYGRALLVGGSRGMAGAIALAGRAALRSGAGLVTLAVPDAVQEVVASFEPSYMTVEISDALTKAADMTAVALGPGLGRSETITNFVDGFYRAVDRPMVVDADALFALAKNSAALFSGGGPRVLTPHAGEFGRLTGQQCDKYHRVSAAAQLARGEDHRHRQFRKQAKGDAFREIAAATGEKSPAIVVVLKGHETVVTDGKRVSVNHTGNPGMATGGSGDVLTGVITALLCQGLSTFDAARLGVHVHGVAGDLAAAELGQVSLIASDLIEYLPKAFQAIA